MGFDHSGIAAERNPEKHAKKRKLLAPGFSPAAIRGYEIAVRRYVNMFVAALEERGKPGGKGVDFGKWAHFMAFDITGFLVFSEDFKALETGEFPDYPMDLEGRLRIGRHPASMDAPCH